MTHYLKTLFIAIAQTQSELQLQQTVMSKIGEYFAAKRYRLFLLSHLHPIANKSKLFQLAFSLEHNPVLRYLVENHVPVHEEILLTAEKWRTICPRWDHGHVMVGPIVDNGSLIGGLALTRDRDDRAFNNQNILELSALCLHISTQLTKIQSQQIKFNQHSLKQMTPRELHIAELVAQGLTNAEIGKTIWITENSVKQALKRMFSKLQVSSRAEMIAKLSRYNCDR
ncbi:Response regulator containing a CheY-like receiver domain and an HTH DNA-binding domain [Hyella patelloides LEGE 07179]|uniref:Response regulator containing a CheY-like receiver domain and an HTH DNA-binding domain n=1 Tax=Hyella patelloides LEGE 07179 TaxID=945734 RepID=A0A563VZN5_9CYAN|nr:LuxR C-terminal-related transcriptional regulator [Hyella patelloides]VEP16880.1 Response regulator containing a CheY-like receiver domain and an HTH DNA-binding domain [Hyella patelloides LEGE 07179]